MKPMTNKEKLEDASARLKSQKKYLEYDRWKETYQIAIDCIDKQIPKRPIIENDDCSTLICPTCKKPIVNVWNPNKYEPNYCHYCGTALDWGTENG